VGVADGSVVGLAGLAIEAMADIVPKTAATKKIAPAIWTKNPVARVASDPLKPASPTTKAAARRVKNSSTPYPANTRIFSPPCKIWAPKSPTPDGG
jgi:hypothetical protein